MAAKGTCAVLPAQPFAGGIDCSVDLDGVAHTVRFEGAGLSEAGAAEAGLALALMPAMRASGLLRVPQPTSTRLLAAIPTIQDIIGTWEQRFPIYGRYRRVDVDAPASRPSDAMAGRGTAAFFSGGADSFYTAIRHRSEIDALIFVHGFDFDFGEHTGELTSLITSGVRAAAAELGLPLVEVRTDVRRFSDSYVHWEAYHGAAMATVAHLLATRFRRILIPATLTYADLMPLGSHPLLDPLWSSEAVELVHVGCEASRLEKLAAIAGEPAARQWLRVCWENRGSQYNCGVCEKCLRTMVALRALGLLEQFEAFPHSIDPIRLSRVELPELRYTWDASLRMLHREGIDPDLQKVLRHRLFSPRAQMMVKARRYAWKARSLVQSRMGSS